MFRFNICSPDIDWQCFPQSHIHPCHCCLKMQEVVISKKRDNSAKIHRGMVSAKKRQRGAQIYQKGTESWSAVKESWFFSGNALISLQQQFDCCWHFLRLCSKSNACRKDLFQNYRSPFVFVRFFELQFQFGTWLLSQ